MKVTTLAKCSMLFMAISLANCEQGDLELSSEASSNPKSDPKELADGEESNMLEANGAVLYEGGKTHMSPLGPIIFPFPLCKHEKEHDRKKTR